MEIHLKKRLYLIVLVLISLIAVPTLITQYQLYLEYRQKKQWPIIEAQVIQTRIVGKRAILPEITYQYQVAGSTYLGTTDLQTPPFGLRNKRDITARAIVKEHPVGSTLKIAYNPDHPEQSTTGLHLPWNFYIKISFALSLLLFGLFFVLPKYRKLK